MTGPRKDGVRGWRWLLLGAIAATGTGIVLAAGGADVASQQARLRLVEEPKKVQQGLEGQKTLVALRSKRDAGATEDVVIRGQIGGMPNVWPDLHPTFPWYEKQASFF